VVTPFASTTRGSSSWTGAFSRISFEAEGGGTRMTLVDGPYTEEVRGNAEAGWTDLVANLEALLRS
jgi:hypothetical protein